MRLELFFERVMRVSIGLRLSRLERRERETDEREPEARGSPLLREVRRMMVTGKIRVCVWWEEGRGRLGLRKRDGENELLYWAR